MARSDIFVLNALVTLTEGEKCRLSISKIASEAGVSYRTAQYALNRLVASERVRRTGLGCRVPYDYEVLNESGL